MHAATEAGDLRYAFRSYSPAWLAAPASVPPALGMVGYGVVLAYKDTEYSASNDLSSSEEPGAGAAVGVATSGGDLLPDDDDDDDDADGLLWRTLVARRPDVGGALERLRGTLAAAHAAAEVKLWDMRSVGLRAAERILSAAARAAAAAAADDASASTSPPAAAGERRHPLDAAVAISHNLPLLARRLARARPRPQWAAPLKLHAATLGAELGDCLRLNGREVPAHAVSAAPLLELLAAEARHAARLRVLLRHGGGDRGAEAEAAEGEGARVAAVLTAATAASSAEAPPRLVVGGEAAAAQGAWWPAQTLWLNDLEADARYAAWPEDLSVFLKGGLPFVRRNALAVVVLVEAGDHAAGEAAAELLKHMRQGAPARLGLLPVSSPPAAGGAAAASEPAGQSDEESTAMLSRFGLMGRPFGGLEPVTLQPGATELSSTPPPTPPAAAEAAPSAPEPSGAAVLLHAMAAVAGAEAAFELLRDLSGLAASSEIEESAARGAVAAALGRLQRPVAQAAAVLAAARGDAARAAARAADAWVRRSGVRAAGHLPRLLANGLVVEGDEGTSRLFQRREGMC